MPVWLDEIADVPTWHTDFLKHEAKEVVQAVGAWIYCFCRPVTAADVEHFQSTLKSISDVVDQNGGYGWEGVRLAVAMPQSTTPYLQKEYEEWDGMCGEHGFEYIDFEATGRNEFGEPVGVERMKEALESNDWAADDMDEDVENSLEDLGIDEEGEWTGGLSMEEMEMGRELFGLKGAVNGSELGEGPSEEDEAGQVEELEKMMAKMHAIKDLGSSMPEEERKRFAAKAVNDFMKDLK